MFDPGEGTDRPLDEDELTEAALPDLDEELAAEEDGDVLAEHDERWPVDPRAYGYTNEEAMLRDVRERLRLPDDYTLAVYRHMVDGQPMIAVAVAAPDARP